MNNNQNIHDWLKQHGFAPFHEVHSNKLTYENRALFNGGVRIEVCDDVASVWCSSKKVNILSTPSSNIPEIVKPLL